MYKYLYRFSEMAGLPLEDQTTIHFDKEQANPLSVEPTGPNLNVEGNKDLFIDWNSQEYLTRDYTNLTEKAKQAMSVDEILSYYLFTLSQKVNANFYLVVLRFVIGYWECINKYGWEKKAENDPAIQEKYKEKWQSEPAVVTPPPDDIAQKGQELKERAGGMDYAVVNNAEHAPEVCNEFVTIFF